MVRGIEGHSFVSEPCQGATGPGVRMYGYLSGSTGIGPDPKLVDAREVIRRVSELQKRDVSREQCKAAVFNEFLKRTPFYDSYVSGNSSWQEWSELVDAAYGVDVQSNNPVIREVIKIKREGPMRPPLNRYQMLLEKDG